MMDGQQMVENFAKAHGLNDLGHARALMFIETFRPQSSP
jgi:hypothetical protein